MLYARCIDDVSVYQFDTGLQTLQDHHLQDQIFPEMSGDGKVRLSQDSTLATHFSKFYRLMQQALPLRLTSNTTAVGFRIERYAEEVTGVFSLSPASSIAEMMNENLITLGRQGLSTQVRIKNRG